jgi:hypothetical protein
MKRRGYFLSVAMIAWIGVMGWVVTIHPQGAPGARGQVAPPPGQQPAAPAPAGGGAGRGGGLPGTENGWSTFQTRCSICHSNPGPNQGPTAEAIRLMTPEKIFEALTTGKMKTQAEGIAEPQLRRVAEFMSGRPMGSSAAGDASKMPNKCATNPTITNLNGGWIGWGLDNANTRFQSERGAGLTAAQVPNLKLKWAFGFPTGETSSSQPTVAGGRVFVGSDNGYIYSLDAATGCVYWSFEAGSIVRGAVTVGPVTGQGSARFAVFFGDGHAKGRKASLENEDRRSRSRQDHRRNQILRRKGDRSGFIVRGIRQWKSRLSLLYFSRQCRRSRCQYRQASLEVLGRHWRSQAC